MHFLPDRFFVLHHPRYLGRQSQGKQKLFTCSTGEPPMFTLQLGCGEITLHLSELILRPHFLQASSSLVES